MRYRGYEVSINSGGQILEEYSEQVEDEKSVSCWIASEAGKVSTGTILLFSASITNEKQNLTHYTLKGI